MIICLLVITFFAVIATGPAGVEWREKRRARLDRPTARVLYLASGACRECFDRVNDECGVEQ